MSNAAQPSLLRRLMGMRCAPAVPALDPADMGTAIGLDFCLDQPQEEAVVARARAQPGHVATRSLWLRRRGAV